MVTYQPNARDNLSVDGPMRYLRRPALCIICPRTRTLANSQRSPQGHMEAHDALAPWESFYVIVGSAAAALTGLQFVVMALINDVGTRTGTREIEAFGTPNVVHFCTVLLFSAILSAPWPSMRAVSVTMGVIGVLGLTYVGIVWRRAGRTTQYTPVLEDWIWHVALPLLSHAAVVVGALFTLTSSPYSTMFDFGAASLILLFVGIHNAWDTVTYIALVYRPQESSQPSASAAPSPPVDPATPHQASPQ